MPLTPLKEYLDEHPNAIIGVATPPEPFAVEPPLQPLPDQVPPSPTDHPWYRERRWQVAGAAVLMVSGMITGSRIGSGDSPATTQAPAVSNHTPAGTRPTSGSPAGSPSPRVSAVGITLPAAWSNCDKPLANLTIGANSGVYVPVKLTNGRQAPLKFQPDKRQAPTYPQAAYYGSLGAAACLKNQASPSVLNVTGGVVTVSRGDFLTIGLFPNVNKAGSPNRETVQELPPADRLAANAQISRAEAAVINSEMLKTGQAHQRLGQTVDYLLRDQIQIQATNQLGSQISGMYDAALAAALKAANPGLKDRIVFNGNYPALNLAYEQATASFTPLAGIKLVNPVVGATIIQTKQQAG